MGNDDELEVRDVLALVDNAAARGRGSAVTDPAGTPSHGLNGKGGRGKGVVCGLGRVICPDHIGDDHRRDS